MTLTPELKTALDEVVDVFVESFLRERGTKENSLETNDFSPAPMGTTPRGCAHEAVLTDEQSFAQRPKRGDAKVQATPEIAVPGASQAVGLKCEEAKT